MASRRVSRMGTVLSVIALLAACSGGGSGSVSAPGTGGSPTPTAGCSLRERQDWAAAQLNEWYLFPSLLATGVNPANYSDVQSYIDALVAPARAQSRDRFFTYITSIAEENAFFNSGSSAGFGVRLKTDVAARTLFIAEAFEGAPALAAGIDRGTEILAIGTSSANLRLVSDIIAAEGEAGISAAIGPSDAGVTRVLRIRDAAGTREVSVTKAVYELTPVSSRYGARIITEGGRQYGYLNLRTFINTADPALRNAFAQFRAAGVTDIVVDVRYNGGGLVSIANLMGDLLGRDRSTGDVFSFTTYRPEKSSNNSTRFFSPQAQSIAPTRIAFIGTGATASASELVINAFIPYLSTREALVGANTYGKTVGQIALDSTNCDDRLRVVAFRTENRDRQGDYYTGLASVMPVTCAAADDVTRPLGDLTEASVRTAVNFLQGQSCTPIAGTGGTAGTRAATDPARLLTPERPSVAQREVTGLF